jgi:ribosome-binding factor A
MQRVVAGKSHKEVIKETKKMQEKRLEKEQKEEKEKQYRRLGIKERDIPKSAFKPSLKEGIGLFDKENEPLQEDDPDDLFADFTPQQRNASSKIHATLESVLHLEVKDPQLKHIEIKYVYVSPGYRHAKVKWAPFAGYLHFDRMQAINQRLNQMGGYLGGKIAKRAGLKFAPKLQFFFDIDERDDTVQAEPTFQDKVYSLMKQQGIEFTDEEEFEIKDNDLTFRSYVGEDEKKTRKRKTSSKDRKKRR